MAGSQIRREYRLNKRIAFLVLVAGLMGIGASHGSVLAQLSGKTVSGAPTAGMSAQPLDLNTATIAQLKTLPGIGDAYAKRIVDGRPFTAKNQLVTKGILPQGTYDKIKDAIIARRATTP